MGAVTRRYGNARQVEGNDFTVVEWTSDPLVLEQPCELSDTDLVHEPGVVCANVRFGQR